MSETMIQEQKEWNAIENFIVYIMKKGEIGNWNK